MKYNLPIHSFFLFCLYLVPCNCYRKFSNAYKFASGCSIYFHHEHFFLCHHLITIKITLKHTWKFHFFCTSCQHLKITPIHLLANKIRPGVTKTYFRIGHTSMGWIIKNAENPLIFKCLYLLS
jgi:hypothetical protein